MIARGSGEHKPISIGEPDKVQSWPFKEKVRVTDRRGQEDPEPKKKDPPKDAGIRLVDYEMEKAIKRTAAIKKLMGAPGTLGLPPLLEAARLKWGIPDAAFEAEALFDRIHIFPIDVVGIVSSDGEKTEIYRPEAAIKRDLQNGHRGVLISMGLEAADHCVSHGTELGHLVRTIRNAPHAQEFARIGGEPMYYLVMRDGDLTSNETLRKNLRSGATRIVDEGGEFSYCFQIEGRKKKVALIQDNW